MRKPDDIPQDVWDAAIKCAETALRNLDGDYGDMTIEITAIARAILAARSSVIVALNEKGEERAMANLSDPWPIDEFLATMKGWAEIPGRRIAIRNGGA